MFGSVYGLVDSKTEYFEESRLQPSH
ncbi:hypothetical protein MPNT_90059 [Candidatus Methylacidithermus pantelleriae]|uniref:Uncharacterized protein n=1 Tax=Candidatus Methylacidithermus pantelleriae TaxID=2744239 RepID=A0A8J2BWU0_9BACT|nr:hypothetical protein MPNT_90059 [Candidatus Methylacidithermus pantelleriae]